MKLLCLNAAFVVGTETSGEEIRMSPTRFELVKAHFSEYLNTVLELRKYPWGGRSPHQQGLVRT
jgi:hypothetical protein